MKKPLLVRISPHLDSVYLPLKSYHFKSKPVSQIKVENMTCSESRISTTSQNHKFPY